MLTWSYRVIRLWELEAEALLATGRPAVLALVGQTRMAYQEQVLPQVVATFKAVSDAPQPQTLFRVLLDLITDEEVLRMLETSLDTDDLGLDTALGRIRRPEREEGRVEGASTMLQRTLLDAVQVRLHPPDAVLAQVATRLAAITDNATLHTLFHAAL